MSPESFVDSITAAEFLAVSPRYLLDLTRAGRIPGHPLSLGRKRRIWRFRLSELASCLRQGEGSLVVLAKGRAKSTQRPVNVSGEGQI
jgi:excisionase family DNA binding protein